MPRARGSRSRTSVRTYENTSRVLDRADAALSVSLFPLGTLVLARVFGASWSAAFGMAGVVAIGTLIDANGRGAR